MPSFDVVSEIDSHELANAVDQANREVSQRFDFRGTGANFELAEHLITLHAQVDFQLKQMLDILKLKLAKRGIDIVCLEPGEPEIALNAAKQNLVLRHGIDAESGRKLQRLIKDSKLKIQALEEQLPVAVNVVHDAEARQRPFACQVREHHRRFAFEARK